MDIHAPDKPVHSFKDFLVHIAIVTVGILIALALDGAREALREHRLVRETRENFRQELQYNRDRMVKEIGRIDSDHKQLDALVADLPALAQQHPEQVAARLAAIRNPNYIFTNNAWQTALSTGVMAHMPTDEISTYAWAVESARAYAGLQMQALDAETRADVFWQAHPHPTADNIADGTERILMFSQQEKLLAGFAPQVQDNFDQALAAASH